MKKNAIQIAILIVILLVAVVFFLRDSQPHTHEHEEHEHAEGRVEITPEALAKNHIEIEQAGAKKFPVTVKLFGKINPIQEKHVDVVARFSGVAKEAYKNLGDHVVEGDVLGIIESDESLQTYSLKAPITGTIIAKEINGGEHVSLSEKLYTITDLDKLWVDFTAFPKAATFLLKGQNVHVKNSNSALTQESKIFYISPVSSDKTQATLVRAEIENSKGEWRPGMFVTGEVTVDEVNAPVAVKESAIQKQHDDEVVFIKKGDAFEMTPIKTGRRNEEWVEVVSGISPGDFYVSKNSFILKSDVGKSGATHEH